MQCGLCLGVAFLRGRVAAAATICGSLGCARSSLVVGRVGDREPSRSLSSQCGVASHPPPPPSRQGSPNLSKRERKRRFCRVSWQVGRRRCVGYIIRLLIQCDAIVSNDFRPYGLRRSADCSRRKPVLRLTHCSETAVIHVLQLAACCILSVSAERCRLRATREPELDQRRYRLVPSFPSPFYS